MQCIIRDFNANVFFRNAINMEAQRVKFHGRTFWYSTAPFPWIAMNHIYRMLNFNHSPKYETKILIKWVDAFITFINGILKVCARVFFFHFYKISRYSFIYFRICWIIQAQRVYKILCFYLLSYNVDEIRYELQFLYGRFNFLFSFGLKPFCEIYKLSINTVHTAHTSY